MTLWSGYEFNKQEFTPDPIINEIPVLHLDVNLKPVSETKTAGGTYYMFGQDALLFTANAFVMMEMFGENRSITWMYYFDEFHWIWQGKCDLIYSLASTGNTVKKTIRLEEGDFVITPRGCIAEFKVLPGGDLRRICGLMPGYALHPYIVERNKKEAAEAAAKAGK